MARFTVPSTGVYTSASSGKRFSYVQGDSIDRDHAVDLGMAGAYAPVTASSDGLGTGLYPEGSPFEVVASPNANNIITLPAPVPGTTVGLRNGATGYELRSSDPGSVAINGGKGAAAESAIPASVLVICVCDTETTWLCSQTDTAGITTAVEVAAP